MYPRPHDPGIRQVDKVKGDAPLHVDVSFFDFINASPGSRIHFDQLLPV